MVTKPYQFKIGQVYFVKNSLTGKFIVDKQYEVVPHWYTGTPCIVAENGIPYFDKDFSNKSLDSRSVELGIVKDVYKEEKEMFEFKKGDVVKCIDPMLTTPTLTKGKLYTVKGISNGCYLNIINDNGILEHFLFSRFILHSEKPPVEIEVDYLYDYIQEQDLSVNEILAFLRGYKKGAEFGK